MAEVRAARTEPGLLRLQLALPEGLDQQLTQGASIAVDGVCLTVTGWQGQVVHFDVMAETLARTTLAERRPGDRVNVERSLRQGEEIGGHPVSGHVDGTAEILAVDQGENDWRVRYRPPAGLLKYLLPRGFVALNGCSLTVAAVEAAEGWFEVAYIPETLRATVHGELGRGDRVNLEVDRQTQAIVDTVERVLAARGEFAP